MVPPIGPACSQSIFGDRGEGFFGKCVKRAHTEFQMLFFCIFDFVVTDPMEALDEHHDGGDTGTSDFSGIVEWTGRETMRLAPGLGDRVRAHFYEVGIEMHGLDLPDAFP